MFFLFISSKWRNTSCNLALNRALAQILFLLNAVLICFIAIGRLRLWLPVTGLISKACPAVHSWLVPVWGLLHRSSTRRYVLVSLHENICRRCFCLGNFLWTLKQIICVRQVLFFFFFNVTYFCNAFFPPHMNGLLKDGNVINTNQELAALAFLLDLLRNRINR